MCPKKNFFMFLMTDLLYLWKHSVVEFLLLDFFIIRNTKIMTVCVNKNVKEEGFIINIEFVSEVWDGIGFFLLCISSRPFANIKMSIYDGIIKNIIFYM